MLNPLGDSNGDGRIDSVDASQIMDLYSRISTMSAIADAKDIAEQDVNGDGRIDSVDASTVLPIILISLQTEKCPLRNSLRQRNNARQKK
ncbi:dockerin type I domain-containing protein [Ruminococcus flavefaciens]|uniref:dockerin type I domain-containing protein n=1 Tax=Ruminococcus flavefaciens TaxID=1265 RepID=UPI00031E908E|nr:dockerin type I domain-containing protein [Ruminococcus flavefaciens]